MKKFAPLLIILLLSFSNEVTGEEPASTRTGFYFESWRRSDRIEGKVTHNLVIVPMRINDSPPLNFILDTGVNTTILTEPLMAYSLGLEVDELVYVLGIGNQGIIEAGRVNDLTFKLGKLTGYNMDMIILPEGILSFTEIFGFPVHGILGYDLFSRFPVKINYFFESVRIFKEPTYRIPRKGKVVPLKIENNKPYITVELSPSENEKPDSIDLMMDLGATQPLFLSREHIKKVNKTIPAFLGKGISGNLTGELGRLDSIRIDDFRLDDPLVAFPNEEFLNHPNIKLNWTGLVGGGVLKRFHLIIDYQSEHVIMKKNYKYKDRFNSNPSGIEVIAGGVALNKYTINYVRKGSPGYEAGLKPGDIIINIDNRPTRDFSLDQVVSVLSQSEGTIVNIEILRDKKVLNKSIRLRNDI